jgi:hypothetical protein
MALTMVLMRRGGAALVCVLCGLAWAAPASASGAPAPPVIQLKPSMSKPAITPFAFAAAARGPSALAPTARGGAIVRYGAFNIASVAFSVQRSLPGRQQGTRCVKPTARNTNARRCARYIAVGRFRYAKRVPLGVVRFRFTGRVAGHKLKPGSYRLLGVPRNATGTTGRPEFAPFNIR